MHIRVQESGFHQEITVYDTTDWYGEKGSFRVLQFANGDTQGAIDLNHPERMLFEYPRTMIHLLKHNVPESEDVFIIGHGIGTIAGHLTGKRCKVAEIDARVVELSRTWFGYRLDNVTIGDGRRILEQEKPHTYDCVVLDAFTEKGTPQTLISREFFDIIRDKLNGHGMVLLNLMGKGEHDPVINAVHTTLSESFSYTRAFVLPSAHAGEICNVLMIGSGRPIGCQARRMAGFRELEPGPGYVIRDKQQE
ncbi:fused MFS/spermidine synthase [Paenibacillus filicis]|uniref:Fused MFS/spermidine synthase n=1 Tax=Paenibacillus filicis TaxID=669464 RepID=A0ABU9DFG3_9BACL